MEIIWKYINFFLLVIINILRIVMLIKIARNHIYNFKRALMIANLLESNAQEIAALESFCMGKPYQQALLGEIPFAASVFRYYAGAAVRIIQ